MQDITAKEVGRNLEISAYGEVFVVPPLPAAKGAALHMQLMSITFGTFAPMEPEEQVSLFRVAMGAELYDHVQNTLRLSEVTPVALSALYWNTVGMEAVEAFLEGGPSKVVETILFRNGLQPQTSPSLAAAVTTPLPDGTSVTGIRSGGETK